MHNVWLIAKREYIERIRAKSFIVMTVLIPLIMGAIIGGATVLISHGSSTNHLAVVTSDPQFANDLRTELTPLHGPFPQLDVYASAEPGVRQRLDAQLQTRSSTLAGYLVVMPPTSAQLLVSPPRPTFLWVPKSKGDTILRSKVADAVRAALMREHLSSSGMAPAQIDSLLAPVPLENASGGNSAAVAVGSAYGMFFLMYFVILFYGMNVARSIIEEKTSRVFEVLLATIRPSEMLAGKVIGVGAVGLTQVGIWIIVGLAAVELGLVGSGVHILPSALQTVFFVVFFLLGYLLYSSLAAALGASTNSEQELQQMNIFLMLPLIACFVVIFSVVSSPDGILATVFSFIPFCTPLIMYTRLVLGNPGALSLGISIGGLVVTIAVVLWFASRIYRVGILMYGKRPSPSEILRWLRYS